jgi:hypothetical protein
MKIQLEPGQGSGGMWESVRERERGAKADGEAIEQFVMEVGSIKINAATIDVKAS